MMFLKARQGQMDSPGNVLSMSKQINKECGSILWIKAGPNSVLITSLSDAKV